VQPGSNTAVSVDLTKDRDFRLMSEPETWKNKRDSPDCAICLEVSEHIPKDLEKVFLDNIANAAWKQLFISWALPSQPGHGHVNCRTTEWVVSEILKRGWENGVHYDEPLGDPEEYPTGKWELDEELTLKARFASGNYGGGRGNSGWSSKLLVFRRQHG